MMTDRHQLHIHGSTGMSGLRPQSACVTADRSFTKVISVSPVSGAPTGENRLQANTRIAGVRAHAAVRMHVSPVFGFCWAYGPKTKTPRFQRLKVAT